MIAFAMFSVVSGMGLVIGLGGRPVPFLLVVSDSPFIMEAPL